jgi:diguanylate cyclase (GGDEF)-like protein
MTGFLNRESFFAVLDGSRRKSDRGALLLIDADHFKKINDSFGHLVGDEALVAIAGAIGRGVRRGDTVGRIGGEEFAAFLPGAGDGDAARVAERIRREVEAVRFLPAGCGAVPLTVSIGGAPCVPDAGVSDLMRVADRRLYEAKRRGRNRAFLGQDMPAAASAGSRLSIARISLHCPTDLSETRARRRPSSKKIVISQQLVNATTNTLDISSKSINQLIDENRKSGPLAREFRCPPPRHRSGGARIDRRARL